jgi:hypothetical protein
MQLSQSGFMNKEVFMQSSSLILNGNHKGIFHNDEKSMCVWWWCGGSSSSYYYVPQTKFGRHIVFAPFLLIIIIIILSFFLLPKVYLIRPIKLQQQYANFHMDYHIKACKDLRKSCLKCRKSCTHKLY